MLQDYRDWLEDETVRLEEARDPGAAFARRALDRFATATDGTLYVALGLPAVRRVLTALQLIEQQTTAEAPALIELRTAIQTALDQAIQPEAHTHDPVEAEIF